MSSNRIFGVQHEAIFRTSSSHTHLLILILISKKNIDFSIKFRFPSSNRDGSNRWVIKSSSDPPLVGFGGLVTQPRCV
jgi:hypothetical protein